jgi:hypothetical protein
MPRQTIPITTFTLRDAEPGSDVDEVGARPETDWLPATVPGGVHEALRDGELAEIAVRGLTADIGDDQLRAISGLTR